jgi:hypothetical protein
VCGARLRDIAVMLGAFALSACWQRSSADDLDEKTHEPSTEELIVVEYPALLTRMLCEPAERCCDSELQQVIYGDATCETYFGILSAATVSDLLGSVRSGRALYHPEVLRACVESQEATSCEQLDAVDVPPNCNEPWVTPLVALDDACARSMECIEGYCIGVADDDADMPDGVCVPLEAEDAPCSDGAQCETGFCSEDDVRCAERESRSALEAICPFDDLL